MSVINKKDLLQFETVCDEVSNVNYYIRFFKIRNILNWNYNKFNKFIDSLIYQGLIEVHQGDPSVLTDQDYNDSYFDNDDNFYLSFSIVED